MKRPALLSHRILPWLMGGLVALSPRLGYGQATDDLQQAKQAFAELEEASQRDGGHLWGTTLYGPTLLVASDTRRVLANVPDSAGVLRATYGVFAGELPAEVNLANTAQPLADEGTIYPTLRVTDTWGILTVDGGALMSPQGNQVNVGYPSAVQARLVTGPGYTLELKEGWQVLKEHNSENYVLLPVPTQP